MLRHKPGPQLVQGHVRTPGHLGPDRLMMRGELEGLVRTLGPCLCLPGLPTPRQDPVDVGHANPEPHRNYPGSAATIHRCQHPPA